jgi:hypothetical protein
MSEFIIIPKQYLEDKIKQLTEQKNYFIRESVSHPLMNMAALRVEGEIKAYKKLLKIKFDK